MEVPHVILGSRQGVACLARRRHTYKYGRLMIPWVPESCKVLLRFSCLFLFYVGIQWDSSDISVLDASYQYVPRPSPCSSLQIQVPLASVEDLLKQAEASQNLCTFLHQMSSNISKYHQINEVKQHISIRRLSKHTVNIQNVQNDSKHSSQTGQRKLSDLRRSSRFEAIVRQGACMCLPRCA